MKYVYPAIFEEAEEGGYTVTFPDTGGATEGNTLYEALEMAEDALNGMLSLLEDKNIPAPDSTFVKDIITNEKSFVTLIRADTDRYRKLLDISRDTEQSA